MAQEESQGASEINGLLGEREQLQEWLKRLPTATNAPGRVKDRVRTDYQGRLSEVVTRLRGFSATLTASTNEVKARLAQVLSVKAEVEEERAEGELRHAVGEFEDAEWQAIDQECQGKLAQLNEEIAGLSGEIERLEEVLSQIAPPGQSPQEPERLNVQVIEPGTVLLEAKPAREADAPSAVQEEDHAGDLVASQETPKPRVAEAPRFTPRTGMEAMRPKDRPPRTIPFPQRPAEQAPGVDEMTFLKSVAIEGPEGEESQQKRTATNAKTLKCTECGSMNRPTEWYCERCGAELAAL